MSLFAYKGLVVVVVAVRVACGGRARVPLTRAQLAVGVVCCAGLSGLVGGRVM